ncbi:MAG: catalase [Candidatus Kapaibacterium sp.]|nr:MAG: catalase [Candidatus Kapabacteria bacterium]
MAHQPSTDWREITQPNEEQRYAEYARQFSEIQERKSAKHGKGRGLHRKQILGLPATLEVLPNLPDHARAGLFAQAGTYQALVRLSNGGSAHAPDKVPDIRGFSFKVLGVQGASALGGETSAQDFLLINREVFGMKGSAEFAGLVKAAEGGPSGLLKHFIRQNGFFAGFKKIKELQGSMAKPFHGFAAHTFFSSAPISCGKYAVRVRLVPEASNGAPANSSEDWSADVIQRLEKSSLSYNVQVQFFVSEKLTPIEDGSVNWEESFAPYLTVARLTIPHLSEWATERDAIQTRTEQGTFDPWCALAEHRPLGDIMRARKVVYYQSQKNRGAV